MIVLVDNTHNLRKAYMTPKLIKIIENYTKKPLITLSNEDEVNKFILNNKESEIHGFILSGGPLCLSDPNHIHMYKSNIQIMLNYPKIPVFGICFGFQVIVECYGGKVSSITDNKILKNKYFPERKGNLNCKKINDSFLIEGISETDKFKTFHSHKDIATKCPVFFKCFLRDSSGKIIEGIDSCFKNKNLGKRCGVQFHPEANKKTHFIIKNFLDLCYKKNKDNNH